VCLNACLSGTGLGSNVDIMHSRFSCLKPNQPTHKTQLIQVNTALCQECRGYSGWINTQIVKVLERRCFIRKIIFLLIEVMGVNMFVLKCLVSQPLYVLGEWVCGWCSSVVSSRRSCSSGTLSTNPIRTPSLVDGGFFKKVPLCKNPSQQANPLLKNKQRKPTTPKKTQTKHF